MTNPIQTWTWRRKVGVGDKDGWDPGGRKREEED
jgi:hypothetical protein